MSEIQLETERLRLRMWREDDFKGYAEICADPEVMRYLGGKPSGLARPISCGFVDRFCVVS